MTLLDRVRFSAVYVAFACLCVQMLSRPESQAVIRCGIWAVIVALCTVALDLAKDLLNDKMGD